MCVHICKVLLSPSHCAAHAVSLTLSSLLAHLVSVQWNGDGQAALPVVPPALQEPLLGLDPLPLPLHAPLTLPEALQVLLILQHLGLQLLALAAQPLGLQEALLLPLLQHALLLALKAQESPQLYLVTASW